MALNAGALQEQIVAEVLDTFPVTSLESDELRRFAGAVARAVVAHLVAAAVVMVPGQPPGRLT